MQLNSEDTSERRFEIECKLEAELAALETSKSAEEQNRKLTNGMINILTSLEDRLATLQSTILPVYNETSNLQRQQLNIEKTLTLLDHAIGYYGVCQEVESTVRGGPNGACGLDGFLDSMNRLYNAQCYFQKNNPSSVELENISTLFDAGLESLYAEFHDILARQSKPVLPIMLLDLIGIDEDTSSEDSPQSLCQLPESTLADLIKISNWLEERGHRRHAKLYSNVRSGIVLKSLQLMKEHQKSASGGSTHASSPMPRVKFAHRHSLSVTETAGRRTSRRLQQALEKKASKIMQKASQTTGLSFPSSRKGAPSPGSHLHHHHGSDDAAPDEQEMDNYLLLAAGLHKLMQAERTLVGRILPVSLQLQVLEATVQDAMDLVAQDGENIASRAKRCIARRDFGAVLVVFPILKHLEELKPDLERTVEGCEYALRSKFASVIQTLTDTGAQALECFGESVRNESGTVLPKDGTVAESTSNVLIFLEQLIEYADTVGAVLKRQTDPDPIGLVINKQLQNEHRIAVGLYIKRVLALLNLALVSRSDQSYSDPALRALFRLNNHNYVINALRRSSLMELLSLAEPKAEQTYLDMLARDRHTYVNTTFAKTRGHIDNHNDEPGSKVLKDRFSSFTRDFEETAKFQRTYAVPDARLRKELRRELRHSLVPLYTNFYHKYRHTSFSKNPAKYIKYSPEQVTATIETFFDSAA
ncbi:exocyst complex component 7 [Trichogramma pretiosum]|uniref:exocyst complex component 7 n=1 Tax=Trichogramma pretiosum TaxID=7493 RepID=UPI0006C95FEE|nr:exocyst complex component 7 [Trichogramma pretiosum]